MTGFPSICVSLYQGWLISAMGKSTKKMGIELSEAWLSSQISHQLACMYESHIKAHRAQ